jgi:hypothetical protein
MPVCLRIEKSYGAGKMTAGGMDRTQGSEHIIRSPKRISITIPHSMYQKIVERSIQEGRSLSNLASFILERGIEQ